MAKPDQVSDPDLRSQIEKAHVQMRTGDPTGAVKTLAAAYIRMIDKKPQMLDASVEMRPGRRIETVMRWPNLGANLNPESIAEKSPASTSFASASPSPGPSRTTNTRWSRRSTRGCRHGRRLHWKLRRDAIGGS